MSLPIELHVALARLNAELGHVRQSIRDLMHSGGVDADEVLATAQYHVLEAAIRSPEGTDDRVAPVAAGAAATVPAVPARERTRVLRLTAAAQDTADLPADEMPLGSGRWMLREHGWLLVAPGRNAMLALKSDERAILLHLARSPEHRIGRDDLTRLGDATPVLGAAADRAMSARPHARVISRLRRRLRGLGQQLPLRASRDGGYRLIGTPAAERNLVALHVVAPGHRRPQAMELPSKSIERPSKALRP
jgi:hypothetical protein